MTNIFEGAGGKGFGGGGSEAPNNLQSRANIEILDVISEGQIEGPAIINPSDTTDGFETRNWMRSIFLDDTPLMAKLDNTLFQRGISVQHRDGSTAQTYIEGLDGVVQTNDSLSLPRGGIVEQTIGESDDPGYQTKRITEACDAIRVLVTFESVMKTKRDSGKVGGHRVDLQVWIKANADSAGSTFVLAGTDVVEGKSTGPYQRAYRISVDRNAAPYDIRVSRVTYDDPPENLVRINKINNVPSSKFAFSALATIQELKLSYPDTALVALDISSHKFGSTVPERKYEVKGIKVCVPSNMVYPSDANHTLYDTSSQGGVTFDSAKVGKPIPRPFVNSDGHNLKLGSWDGSFERVWTDDPAWILYDLLTNDRYGLGDVFKPEDIDKFALYQISRYNSEAVIDGKGGKEARFSFNGVINERATALETLDAVAGMMRCRFIWAGIGISFIQNREGLHTKKIFNRSNVINGKFSYTGSSLTARHSAVKVTWTNPVLGYKQDTLLIEDDVSIQRYGYNLMEETAYGCTSYGQAYRHGLFSLLTERLETEVVTFEVGLANADVRPGDVIEIHDPMFSEDTVASGRIVIPPDVGDGSSVPPDPNNTINGIQVACYCKLDRDVTFENITSTNTGYRFIYVSPFGSIEESRIYWRFRDDIPDSGNGITITTSEICIADNQNPSQRRPRTNPLDYPPLKGAVWGITKPQKTGKKYYVTSVTESEKNKFAVSALEYVESKFSDIDAQVVPLAEDTELPELDISEVKPPTEAKCYVESIGEKNSGAIRLGVRWKKPDDLLVTSYEVRYTFGDAGAPNGVNNTTIGNQNWKHETVTETEFYIEDPALETYSILIFSINKAGHRSAPVALRFDLSAGTVVSKNVITRVYLQSSEGSTFKGRLLQLRWEADRLYTPAIKYTDGNSPYVRDFRVKLCQGTSPYTEIKTFEGIITNSLTIDLDELEATDLARNYRIKIDARGVKQDSSRNDLYSNVYQQDVSNPAPSTPTATHVSLPEALIVTFGLISDADFDRIEIYQSSTNVVTTTTPTASTSNGGSVTLKGSAGSTIYYKYRAFDKFGAGTLSSLKSGTAGSIPESGITEVDLDDFADGIQPIGIVTSLPHKTNQSTLYGNTPDVVFYNKELYRKDSAQANGWTKEVDGADLKNSSIPEGAFKANTITTNTLKAGVVTAAKMSVTNLASINSDLGAVTAGSLNINSRFIVNSSGVVTIKSASSGARLEIDDKVIRVYDANRLRVRLGIW